MFNIYSFRHMLNIWWTYVKHVWICFTLFQNIISIFLKLSRPSCQVNSAQRTGKSPLMKKTDDVSFVGYSLFNSLFSSDWCFVPLVDPCTFQVICILIARMFFLDLVQISAINFLFIYITLLYHWLTFFTLIKLEKNVYAQLIFHVSKNYYDDYWYIFSYIATYCFQTSYLTLYLLWCKHWNSDGFSKPRQGEQ